MDVQRRDWESNTGLVVHSAEEVPASPKFPQIEFETRHSHVKANDIWVYITCLDPGDIIWVYITCLDPCNINHKLATSV